MKNIVLENESLRVEISPAGAEMQSICNKKDGREQLWQGDPAVWKDRAPWLFPLIGQLRGGAYTFVGKTYAMPMHGFASSAVFRAVQSSPTAAEFTFCANEETLELFPWPFELRICYALNGAQLQIDCSVRNTEPADMYFSFGAHPGFLCFPGDMVTFPEDTTLHCQRLDLATHLLLPDIMAVSPAVELQSELFDADAMLLKQPASTRAVLQRKDGSGVRFTFGKTAWVGLWSRAGADLPYICIEPWHGVDDPINATGNIEEKADIVHLPAGEVFSMSMAIEPF